MNKVSVCMVHRNDPYLYFAVNALLKGIDSSRFEIIIHDDCSDEPVVVNTQLYPNVRVIRSDRQHGVGYGLDRCVENCTYENIVLMASDVIVKDPSWIDRCIEYVSKFPKGIGCSGCLEGSPDYLDPEHPMPDSVKRYGANLSIYTEESTKVDCFTSSWIKIKPEGEYAEIPCVYGAFYTANKTWYRHLRGWDTEVGKRMAGFQYWGCLEPTISIKSWLAGGQCHSINNLETLHIFHRFVTEDGIVLSQNGRSDLMWWNKFFLAFTVMETITAERLMNKVIDGIKKYELPIKNPSEGRRLIRYYFDYVKLVQEKNKAIFTRGMGWLCNKFDIKQNY